VRNALRYLFGNWFTVAYLLLVAVLAILPFAADRFGGANTSLGATFLLILVTVPWSLLMPSLAYLPAGWLGNVILFGAVSISALINAALISLVVHAVRHLLRSRAL
jgi:hypothetical protein